jgi:D-alanyl-D-alanine carboxypeptidase/D-alanyl-D-alanine-endopeptidase (penicillin-binding protein 4)
VRLVKVVSGVIAVSVVAVVGYGALDVYDKVPGVLTRDQTTSAPSPRTGQSSTSGAATAEQHTEQHTRIAPVSNPRPPLPRLEAGAPVPTEKGLRTFLAGALRDKQLGNSLGVTIRDASTGKHLLDLSASAPRTPASTTKLLTAAAVTTTLDPGGRFTTKVVQGSSPRSIVLVAGGDSLLSPGKGDRSSTSGHAGLDELATEVKASLARSPRPSKTSKSAKSASSKPLRLTVDDSYAAGPLHAPGWSQGVINQGFVGGVAMLGLSTQRATTGHPASTDPVMSTAWAFREALARHGVTVADAVERGRAPSSGRTLGAVRSAPIGDVLALALDQSDNALTEQLARIAAAHEGARTDFPSVARWVTRTVKGLGIDVTGVHLVDSCGLSTGTRIPARVIGDVLTLATTGRDRALQSVLSQLPVAGLTGTLYDRFLNPEARVADGIARAKTGSLPGVSSLAGTVLDRDGRLLVFVLIADNVRPFTPPAKGKAAGGSRERPGSKGVSGNAWVAMTQVRRGLDAVVARLADCGCRG